MENINIIKLNHDKSIIDNDILIINNKKYDLGDLITIFKTKEQYEEENSELNFAQTHFEDKIAYIEDMHLLVVGGNIDDLSDELDYCDDLDINSFEEFIKEISQVAIEPFKIATVSWEGDGIGVYYMKYDETFQSVHLDHDDWEETKLFNQIAKDNDLDIDSDDFYDDDVNHDEGWSPCRQVCDELYNDLLSDPELLSPDWY